MHPQAVIDLRMSGYIEDAQSAIRLLIVAETLFRARSGNGYWAGNERIAEQLGVPVHAVENAVRRSKVIKRKGKGRGRRAGKAFELTPLPVSSVHTSTPDVEGTRQTDGLQPSVRLVESANLTGPISHDDGCHRNQDSEIKKEDKEEEGKVNPSSLIVSDQSDSFSTSCMSMGSQGRPDDFTCPKDPANPDGLARSFHDLLVYLGHTPNNEASEDLDKASMTLKQVEVYPRRQRRQIIERWLKWYGAQLDGSHGSKYLSSFARSWDDFLDDCRIPKPPDPDGWFDELDEESLEESVHRSMRQVIDGGKANRFLQAAVFGLRAVGVVITANWLIHNTDVGDQVDEIMDKAMDLIARAQEGRESLEEIYLTTMLCQTNLTRQADIPMSDWRDRYAEIWAKRKYCDYLNHIRFGTVTPEAVATIDAIVSGTQRA